MNQLAPFSQQIAAFSVLDVLLADVAIRVQLTPTEYLEALEHYKVMGNWVGRLGSPLYGLVEEFYAQGGFSTGSTVSSHSEKSEFDLDAMVQIKWPRSIDPEEALSKLHFAIAGERGSRYYDKTERKTRCSQVQYAAMHLDVTPCILLGEHLPKTSLIFHSKPSDPRVIKRALSANPHGLANWFNQRVLHDDAFGYFFEDRSLNYNRIITRPRADTKPVPEYIPAYRKSRQVICLQLFKRWRNIAYERRHNTRRLPPSVLITYYVGLHTNTRRSLTDELIYQAECIIGRLEVACAERILLNERNPTCWDDILTDRWPGDLLNQHVFLQELREFVADLKRLKIGMPIADMRKVLEKLFGEKPAGDVVAAFSQRFAEDDIAGLGRYTPRIGSIPALGSSVAPSTARLIPKSTPFGDA